jgi:hypothetical protein
VELGVNVPNFGPGTGPETLLRWARTAEGLGFGLLMVSDHLVVTEDVAAHYPEPFYEPFTTLAWLAGVTRDIRLGTTVLIVPYRHPLLTARMAVNLDRLSGGRLILGVGAGWAKQEFEALGVPFERRGRLTDEYLDTLVDRGFGRIWVGGDSGASMRRADRLGKPWHPMAFTMPWLDEALTKQPVPKLAPRIKLRLTDRPIETADRLAGHGTLPQVLDDLDRLAAHGAELTLLDTYHGDPAETLEPERAFETLAIVRAAYPATTSRRSP